MPHDAAPLIPRTVVNATQQDATVVNRDARRLNGDTAAVERVYPTPSWSFLSHNSRNPRRPQNQSNASQPPGNPESRPPADCGSDWHPRLSARCNDRGGARTNPRATRKTPIARRGHSQTRTQQNHQPRRAHPLEIPSPPGRRRSALGPGKDGMLRSEAPPATATDARLLFWLTVWALFCIALIAVVAFF